MNHTNYNLLQVPTPQVNKDEIDAALRWQIKDLVDIDVENSIIRSYPMPGQGNITSPLIFVVIADRSAIKNITEMVYDAGLNIKSVTSVELGLRSLLKAIEDIKVPTMLLAIFPHKTVFIHMVNGVLYRTRELNYGATHLPGSGSWSEDESWPERLVTEVGRFIIFCARHCDGGSAQRLLVTSTVSSSPDLVEALAEETELVVEELSHGLIDVRCLPALGVAYEGMEQ
jgi:MSHA biogenesis protein MshI